MTTQHTGTQHADAEHLADSDQIAAEYEAYVAHQESDLAEALANASSAVHRATRALAELIELDAPQWTQTTEGDDAQAALTVAARALRAANRCAYAAT
ncbi:hypothetical protein [Kribbella sp. NPDC049227]|uniref:hypothetical protein n=1 Tax=Kribbella sp. NPDC049227 TaxID=3364113 RepID=UPI003715BD10